MNVSVHCGNPVYPPSKYNAHEFTADCNTLTGMYSILSRVHQSGTKNIADIKKNDNNLIV